jgi:hypothetical protein
MEIRLNQTRKTKKEKVKRKKSLSKEASSAKYCVLRGGRKKGSPKQNKSMQRPLYVLRRISRRHDSERERERRGGAAGRKEGRKKDKARERKRNAHAGRQQTTEKETKAGKKERERQPT